MANTVSYTFIAKDKFTAISRKVSKSANNIKKRIKTLCRTVNTESIRTNKSTNIMSMGFAKLAAVAGTALSAVKFVQAGASMQDAMAGLSAITGVTGVALGDLKKDIFALAKTSATSAADVSEAFKLVASAKPELLDNIPALKETTKQVLLLKNAAGIGLAEASNIAAQGLNIFGKGADQAGKFVNVLAAGAKFGSSEIADTGAAMLIAGPAARAAGLDFTSLNAAIQTVAKGGIKAERAGTALNSIFGRLRRAGIDFKEVGLQGAFELVRSELNKVTDSTKRAQLEAKIFGEEHSKVGLALLSNVADLGKFENKLRGTNSAQEQADIRLSTLSAKWRKFKAIGSEVIDKVFTKMAPSLDNLVTKLTEFITKIGDSEIRLFMDVLSNIANLIKIIGRGLSLLVGSISDIGKEISNSLPISLIDSTIGALSKAASSIGGFLGGVSNGGVIQGELSSKSNTQTDINVNVRGAPGTVESVTSKTTGNNQGLRVGTNMAEAF